MAVEDKEMDKKKAFKLVPVVAECFWVTGEIPAFGQKQFFTCFVEVDEYSTILNTCPLLKKFIGQDIENLLRWAVRPTVKPLAATIADDDVPF